MTEYILAVLRNDSVDGIERIKEFTVLAESEEKAVQAALSDPAITTVLFRMNPKEVKK